MVRGTRSEWLPVGSMLVGRQPSQVQVPGRPCLRSYQLCARSAASGSGVLQGWSAIGFMPSGQLWPVCTPWPTCLGVGRGWEATYTMSKIGVCAPTLLPPSLSMWGRSANSGAHQPTYSERVPAVPLPMEGALVLYIRFFHL